MAPEAWIDQMVKWKKQAFFLRFLPVSWDLTGKGRRLMLCILVVNQIF